MRSMRLLLVALGSALSALLVSPVAAAEEPAMAEEAELGVEDVELVSAGTLRKDTERKPAVVLGLKTVSPGRDPEMIGVFLFSRRPRPESREQQQRQEAAPLRIAPARQNGVWVLMAEGRF